MKRWLKLLFVMFVLITISAQCTAQPATTAAPTEAPAAEQPAEPATEAVAEAPTEAAVEAGPVMGGTVVAGMDSDLSTLDPTQSNNATDRHVYHNVFDTLVRLGTDASIEPGLAESWDVSEDGKEYTFHLRQGVKFHDGTDFNADAVKFNLDRARAEGSARASELAAITDVAVVDDSTVKVTLNEGIPFLWNLADRAGMILSPTAVEELGDEIARKAVGTGPFKFVEWIPDDHITLEKNPDYWEAGKPYLDKVIFRPIPEGTVRSIELKSGNVNIIEKVPSQEVDTMKSTEGVEMLVKPGLGYAYVFINGTKPPFDNINARKALAYAIDREQLAELATFGTGYAGVSPIPPTSWAYDPDYKGISYDPEKAKEFLAEAGMPDGFSFQFIVPPWEEFITSAQLMQEEWAAVGIKAEIVQMELTTLLDKLFALDYQALYIDYSGRIDPDPNLWGHTGCDGGNNFSGVCNEEANQLMVEARTTTDQKKRQELYFQAVPLVVEEQISQLYIYYPSDLIAYGKSLHIDYYPDSRFRFENAWLEQ
ncbi:MAG: peptide ABC transporter substrate-binding protein [Chloroflexi bacterium]|nr:peptide ABC transporter substrate-binding protein [Chloroflexota bacterium]